VAPRSQTPPAKTKLLDAAVSVIRTKGYAATTVDDLCAAAVRSSITSKRRTIWPSRR
jgi:AcrR family transcriptional regulator